MSTSQNGWPALASDSPLLVTWDIPDGEGAPTRLRMRQGSAGFLLAHYAMCFDQRVQDLNGPVLDDWAYAYRAVRGYSTTLSNHSSGTAIDLNATQHPLGKVGTFTAEQRTQIEKLLDHYDRCLDWGGDYHNRKDEMHVEIAADLAKCEHVARSLMDSKRGELVLAANAAQRRVILS